MEPLLRPDIERHPQWRAILQKSGRCRIAPQEIHTILRNIAHPLVEGMPRPERPIAFIMCGPPGSGKTYLTSQLLAEHNIVPEEVIMADPDRILTSLRQWSDPCYKMECQKTATYILTDFLLEKLAQTRHHIVFDTTCRAIGNTMSAINLFTRNGYYVILSELYVSQGKALERVKQRYNNAQEANKRLVPPNVVRAIYDEFAGKASVYYGTSFRGAPVSIDELRLYNNEDTPQLLYKRVLKDGKYDVDVLEEGAPFYFNYGGQRKVRKTKKVRRRRIQRAITRGRV